jgi:hypothetical protein
MGVMKFSNLCARYKLKTLRIYEVIFFQALPEVFCEVVETGCGTHPASYSMGTRVSFPGDKEAGARS